MKCYFVSVKLLDCLQDFIDAYIREMKHSPSTVDRDDLIGICQDFFEAGGETVGSTLSWLFLFMALHQEAQEKCYSELHEKLGRVTCPQRLQYSNSISKE